MTKFGGIAAVCFATACITLASCVRQQTAVQDGPNLTRLGVNLQDNSALSNQHELAATTQSKSSLPSQLSEKEEAVKFTAGITPSTLDSGRKTAVQPAPDARQLVGLNGDGLNHLLGKPALLRQEAEVEVWQYRTANCVLHLFLYRDAANSPHRVVHVEAVNIARPGSVTGIVGLASSAQKTILQSCFGRLLHQVTNLNKSS